MRLLAFFAHLQYDGPSSAFLAGMGGARVSFFGEIWCLFVVCSKCGSEDSDGVRLREARRHGNGFVGFSILHWCWTI